MRITPMGDRALVVELGQEPNAATVARVQAAVRCLEASPLPGVTELVPAFSTVTLFYDPVLLARTRKPNEDLLATLTDSVEARLRKLPARAHSKEAPALEIPVCYGGAFGPDLEDVSLRTGLSAETVARVHAAAEYRVYAIGFSPGFPYLGDLPEALAVPRRSTPRTSVPSGSVAIANRQSCVYPMSSPGGWNIIGRTPMKLFRPGEDPPSVLKAGDRVAFRAITEEEFRVRNSSP